MRPYFLSLLAEAFGNAGQIKAALNVLAEAQTALQISDERWWEAEVDRLKGEWLLKSGPGEAASDSESQAIACFQQALAISRAQNAKVLELRATTSFARLLATQGRRDEACTMLSAIYNY